METLTIPGLELDVSWADYLSRDAMSRSDLLELGRSPMHYQWRKKHPDDDETDALLFGKASHCALLEPERFKHAYEIGPVSDRRLKAWKEFEANAPKEKALLTESQGARALAIANALRERQNIGALIRAEGVNEATFGWIHEGGVRCKGRTDRLLTQERVVVDFKSTRDCAPHAFARSVAEYGYHFQAAFYLDGLTAATGVKHEHFLIVAYEPTPPYASCVYRIEDEAVAKGRDEYNALLKLYKRCVEHNEWEDRSGMVLPIGLPSWYAPDFVGLGMDIE